MLTTIRWSGANTWLLTLKDGSIYTFPEAFLATNPTAQALIGIQDRYGNAIRLTRDSNSNLTRVASPSGRYIDFQYDSSNRVTTATDNIGRTVQYAYDSAGRLFTVTDPNGGVTTYTYTDQNQIVTIKNARDIVYLTNQYDSYGRVVQQTLADGAMYQFAWTAASNAAQTYFVNGGSSNVASSSPDFHNCGDCSKGYASLISQVDVTDPRGYVRRVTFNASGYTATDIRALGQPEQEVFTYEYYADNLLKAVVDPVGNRTSYIYDSKGNCTRTTVLDGTSQAASTSMTYAAPYNQVASTTDPLGNTATQTYDSAGNLIGNTDPLGHQTTMAYNSAGQMVSITDPIGNSIHFQYDLGDLVSTTDALSNTTSRFLDNGGRLISTTNPMGQSVRYQYDNLNRLIQTTDPAGNVVSFAYDPNGNRLSVTDPLNHATTYTYDSMDRQSTRTDPLQRTETIQYDLLGNAVLKTDRKGQQSSYSYDSLNRLSFAGINRTTNGTTSYESTMTYAYDSGGRLTQIVDSGSGSISYTYDGVGRISTETTPQGSVFYTYDLAGRRSKRMLSGQPDTNYTYDASGRLTQILQGASSVGFVYDDANRRSVLNLPNGVSANYTYDAGSRLTGITYQLGATSLGTLAYTYDQLGRRTQIAGTLARTSLPSAVSAATYDSNNELTSWNGAAITYDANGNMTGDGNRTFTWNGRNQLTNIGGGASGAFLYDASGRRVSFSGAASKTFFYDGPNAMQENSGAATVLAGGVDEVYQRTEGANSVFPLTDAIGSVIALTDSSGAVQTQYTYDPFGSTTITGASTNSLTAFTGRENDGTGLYYLRARYYNPTFGRFIGEDPTGFRGGINKYAYAGDNPMSLVDPFGTEPLTPTGMINPETGLDIFTYSVGVTDDVPVGIDIWKGQHKLWSNTAAVGNAAAAATGVIVAAPIVADAASSLTLAKLAVGPGQPYGVHFAVGVGGTWLHWINDAVDDFGNVGPAITTEAAEAWAMKAAWFRIPLPVLNPSGVIGTVGQPASNCFTAACYSLGKGWIP